MFDRGTVRRTDLLPDHLVQRLAGGGGRAGHHQGDSKQTGAGGKCEEHEHLKIERSRTGSHLYFSLDRK